MAGCRGSLCCCCRWCCCCGERETRTPEELVRSWRSGAGQGAVAKGPGRGVAGGGAGPNMDRRWQRVGRGDNSLGSGSICRASRVQVWAFFCVCVCV